MAGLDGAPVVGPAPAPAVRPASGPLFAHASEAEFARILDFYAVRWEYEPHVFPILWNLDGAVVESFSPDFHLPDFDTYLELTTLRQPLVRKKNRKLRRLRELYPDIRIKLLYARDFRALMLKYGKFGLVDALSGTSGQVTPPHARTSDVGAAAAGTTHAPARLETDATDAVESVGAVAGSSVRTSRSRRRRRRAGAAVVATPTGSET